MEATQGLSLSFSHVLYQIIQSGSHLPTSSRIYPNSILGDFGQSVVAFLICHTCSMTESQENARFIFTIYAFFLPVGGRGFLKVLIFRLTAEFGGGWFIRYSHRVSNQTIKNKLTSLLKKITNQPKQKTNNQNRNTQNKNNQNQWPYHHNRRNRHMIVTGVFAFFGVNK